MSGRGEPERVFSPSATANFFSLLGVEPVIGRRQTGCAPSDSADVWNVATQVRR